MSKSIDMAVKLNGVINGKGNFKFGIFKAFMVSEQIFFQKRKHFITSFHYKFNNTTVLKCECF